MIEVVACPDRRDLFDIQVNGDCWRRVHASIFGRRPSIPPLLGSFNDWEKQFLSHEYRCAKNFALRQLSRKSQTSMELSQTLRQKLVSEESTAKVIAEITRLGYFDDADWVQRYVKAQLAKGKGPEAIKAAMRTKGISDSMIAQELTVSASAITQKDQLRRLLATRYKGRNLADFKERQKVVGALMRRGFDLDTIRKVVSGNEENFD